jgi:D-inositol-3-phosphate glycosyltransferase
MTKRRGIALLCTTRALGGIELNVLRIASWLRERGHACTVYGIEGAPLITRAHAEALPVHALERPRRYGAFGAARRLAALLNERDERVLFLNAPRDLNLGVLTKRFSRPPVRLIQFQHMQFGTDKRDPFHSWEYRHLDAWISPLPWLAGQVEERTTIPRNRIHVLPFGIDIERFAAKPERHDARGRLHLPEHAFICGTIGRYDLGKAQEYLLRAVASLKNAGLQIHALLVGEDTREEEQGYGTYLRKLSADLGIGDYVHFRPFLDDVETAYAAMDLFVLTSISETYGMVTIEAMASGLPVVATNSAGTPDIVEQEKTGLLVPVRDVEALSGAIRRVFQNRDEAIALGLAAKNEARRRFSHHTYCEGIEAVLDGL